LVLVFAAVALVSCGSSNNTKGVESLLDRAFKSDIKSADLKIDATIQLKGSGALDRPVRIQATGPFHTNKDKLPSADLELQVSTDGGGQTIQTGFLSTGDRAFVKFEDVYYEQPASQVRAANESIRKAAERHGGSSLRSLGLNPRSWLAEAHQEGDARVAGVETRHLSGRLDVKRLMSNINEFVQRSSTAISGATGQKPPAKLSAKEIRAIAGVVKDPQFNVYVAKKDHTIRRVTGRVQFDVPKDKRKELGGIEGGSFEFSVEFDNVNRRQEIVAPARARPLSELTRTLGGANILGGGATGPFGGGGSGAAPNGTGTSTTPSGGATAPNPNDFKRYAQCLDKARPEDTDALQRCARLLQRP
jgi:hypothetical protein